MRTFAIEPASSTTCCDAERRGPRRLDRVNARRERLGEQRLALRGQAAAPQQRPALVARAPCDVEHKVGLGRRARAPRCRARPGRVLDREPHESAGLEPDAQGAPARCRKKRASTRCFRSGNGSPDASHAQTSMRYSPGCSSGSAYSPSGLSQRRSRAAVRAPLPPRHFLRAATTTCGTGARRRRRPSARPGQRRLAIRGRPSACGAARSRDLQLERPLRHVPVGLDHEPKSSSSGTPNLLAAPSCDSSRRVPRLQVLVRNAPTASRVGASRTVSSRIPLRGRRRSASRPEASARRGGRWAGQLGRRLDRMPRSVDRVALGLDVEASGPPATPPASDASGRPDHRNQAQAPPSAMHASASQTSRMPPI
jgi:hypothetical protein